MQFHCAICRNQGNLWQDLENLCVAKCGHTFHLNCLMPHTRTRPKSVINCPASKSDPWSKCDKKIQLATIMKIDPTVIETQKNNTNNVNCNFCDNAVTDPNNVGIAKCGHIYHFDECLLNLVRLKSNPCMAPLCKMKTTQGTIARIHLVVGASDVTQASPASTVSEEPPGPLNNEQKPDVSSVPSCSKEVMQATTAQIHSVPGTSGDVKQKITQPTTVDLQPTLLQENKEFKELNDAKKETKIWEMAFKYLQDTFKDTDLMIPNEKTLDLIKENEKLKMHAQELEKERNYAKKESEIWEMSFTYLQDNFKDSEFMIPNEKTLELIKENEKLKKSVQDLESKAVTAVADLSQANEQILEMNKLREQIEEKQQTIETFQKYEEIDSATKENKGATSLRTDLENYIEENLNLKTENETMKSDIKSLRENVRELELVINNVVSSHSLENTTLQEFSNSLLNENTRLKDSVNILQTENLTLSEIKNIIHEDNLNLKENQTLQEESLKNNNTLDEPNQPLMKEITRLSELYNTLQENNNQLTESNQSLLKEITRLSELYSTLQENNNQLTESNQSLLKEITRLSELYSNLQENKNQLTESNQSLLKEITKLRDQNNALEKEKRDFRWELIINHRSCGNSPQAIKTESKVAVKTEVGNEGVVKKKL